MTDSESSDSPQIKLYRECCQAFLARDPELIAKATHKDYRYMSYPQSLGHPEKTSEGWLEQWGEVIGLLTADSEVSYISGSSDPPAATNSLLQLILRFITDIPGKVVAHVRI
jgi:hypothetical protein